MSDQRDEIVLRESAQRRFAKCDYETESSQASYADGEIAAPTTGDPIFRRAFRLLMMPTLRPRLPATWRARRPCTDDEHVINQRRLHGRSDTSMTGAAITGPRHSAATGMSRNLVE